MDNQLSRRVAENIKRISLTQRQAITKYTLGRWKWHMRSIRRKLRMGQVRRQAEGVYCTILEDLGLTTVLYRHLLRLCRHHLPDPFLWESAYILDYCPNRGLGCWIIKLDGYRPLHETLHREHTFLACRCTDGTVSLMPVEDDLRTVSGAVAGLNSQ